jgi:hypothetical protein
MLRREPVAEPSQVKLRGWAGLRTLLMPRRAFSYTTAIDKSWSYQSLIYSGTEYCHVMVDLVLNAKSTSQL